MEIGGIDLVLEGKPKPFSVDWLVMKAREKWPHAVLESEDNETFIYQNQQKAASWAEHGCLPDNDDSMVHIIESDRCLTLVVGEGMEQTAQGWLDWLKENEPPAW